MITTIIHNFLFYEKNIISDIMNNIITNLYKLKENNPDLIIRNIKNTYIVNYETLTDSTSINDFILKYISNINTNILNIPSINAKIIKEKEIMDYLFNGFALVIKENQIIAFECRANLDRGVSEPSSEPSIRGSKDAFTENYQKNIGLIRKRIKSEDLKIEEYTIGTNTKTKIGIIYMDKVCNESIINDVRKKIELIINNDLIDSNNLKELMIDKKSLFPTIKSTEVPNNAARNILDGKIIITVENTPSVLIIPSFFLDFFKNNEDYNQLPIYASFTRIIRIIAFFVSIILPSFYIALTNFDQEIIPTTLLINFSMQRQNVPFPSIIEIIILLFTFEILHEGDTRIPNNVGSSLSILGALVLGQSAVSAGLISPIIVIVVALSSICSLLFVYHDIEGVIRFYRYFIMILSSFFGIIGLFAGMLILLIDLCRTTSFNKPYLIPIVPYLPSSQNDSVIRKKKYKTNILEEI